LALLPIIGISFNNARTPLIPSTGPDPSKIRHATCNPYQTLVEAIKNQRSENEGMKSTKASCPAIPKLIHGEGWSFPFQMTIKERKAPVQLEIGNG
jgi:hypothetical protein